jgi:hypothetical protein
MKYICCVFSINHGEGRVLDSIWSESELAIKRAQAMEHMEEHALSIIRVDKYPVQGIGSIGWDIVRIYEHLPVKEDSHDL